MVRLACLSFPIPQSFLLALPILLARSPALLSTSSPIANPSLSSPPFPRLPEEICRLFAGWDERGSGTAEFGLIPARDAVVGTARLGSGAGPLVFVIKLPCYAGGGGSGEAAGCGDESGVMEAAAGSRLEKRGKKNMPCLHLCHPPVLLCAARRAPPFQRERRRDLASCPFPLPLIRFVSSN